MRNINVVIFMLFFGIELNAQTSLEKIDLEQGIYKVGFKHYTLIDSTRTYRIHTEFNNELIYRPVPVSIWYPANWQDNESEVLTVLDYLQILKEEEEWGNLPDYFLMDWFPYLWNTPANRAHLPEKATAAADAEFMNGKFPVVIYAASYQASSIENFALFEYLASNGYVLISSPSRGTETRWFEGGTAKDMETQARDVELLLKEVYRYSMVDADQVALIGFSFGGLSNALVVMKNHKINALVSLDGTERYMYELLQKSPYFDLEKLNIPYVHFAQKDIPEAVLKEDKISEELNYEFQLYDSLKYSDVYSYKFHDLTHSYFSSFGVLFANRDKRQDKSDEEIMASYKILCEHTLQFLNAKLKNDKSAADFIENNPKANGFPESLLSKTMKKSLTPQFDYKDFNDLALNQGYIDLVSLYEKTLAAHPNLKLEEGMLNTLGLRFAFEPGKSHQAIEVFALALHLYPESSNLFDSLAEAYLHNKDYENAIKNFNKSLELNPGNQNAINRLKQIEEMK